MSANPQDVSRRTFLKASAAISGGLVLAITLPGCKPGTKPAGELKTIETNAWLRIGTDNTITFLCDRSEMGQGVYTSLPMLIAEELGVNLDRIQVEFAPAGDQFINNLLGTQITGGSSSVRDAWEKLRMAGATAREMLISAAAAEWDIDPRSCKVENGVIVSRSKRLTFGEVAEAAAKLPVPKDIKLKPADQFTLVGKAQKRKDTPSKVDGSCVYGIDVKLPGMLYAALAQSPTLGGKVKSFDDTKARAMPGVTAVVLTSSGVAVVADSWWKARSASSGMQAPTRLSTTPRSRRSCARVLQVPAKSRAAMAMRRPRSRLQHMWFVLTTNCPCWPTRLSNRRTARRMFTTMGPTFTCPRRFNR
jgi:isoquinoline 1-oxidoreductase beta subunit